MKSLTYAIGDIHGCYDLLTAALRWIDGHSRYRPSAHIVFLGDYIDRGPDSRKVIERLMQGPFRPEDTFTCLMGNHEEMLLHAQGSIDERQEQWLRNGGDATLASYDGAIPAEHIAWIRALPLFFEDEYRFFVHAGLNPKLPMEHQTEYQMLWIREPFLSANFDFGRHVVHGHTPQNGRPDLRRFRTNLDTGAVWTGRLCVGVFDPEASGGPVETTIITV